MMTLTNEEKEEMELKKEIRKSLVRVIVTYIAAIFLFGGGGIFIAFLIWTGQRESASDLFLAILPVSAAIISYWFAGRGTQPK